MYDELRTTVERAWDDRSLLQDDTTKAAIREVVELIDKGLLRTAEPVDLACSQWQVNEWVKKAVILYFPIQKMRILRAGELEWYDKMDIKHDYDRLGVRAVPHAVARYGAYIAPGAILMPSYVNIGAYVGEGTMVDTWATVGSCAQIGSHVHLSGGVGIGGVLEPVQAAPVIIEDNCFVGSRAIVVEGAHVCREAVLGSNTVITGSTHIIDVTGPEPVTYKGYVPPRSVVVPEWAKPHLWILHSVLSESMMPKSSNNLNWIWSIIIAWLKTIRLKKTSPLHCRTNQFYEEPSYPILHRKL